MVRVIKSQVWRLYHQAAEQGSIDELRSLSLTFFEAAERLQADIDRRAAAALSREAA